ncbi:MAG: tetratricopeptide repeat protein [Treponema sp.]|nr:tetratricopeptide repeat protein [Treponema sp.]MCL2251507.1 tetratricopeptide repeat protein [Treponema sp.]
MRSGISNEKKELMRVWNEGDYESAYNITSNLLLEKPMDFFLLSVNGFSAFQLGISQINKQNMLLYIDNCIFSLRKALIKNENDGQVNYVLGKAYRYKGPEYADLTVKYLEIADKLAYNAVDIPEYLGLAYAMYGDYRSSVEAFSRAFVPNQTLSDNLLLSIARSYMEMKEFDMAGSYLQQCVRNSQDSKSIIIARFMLAEIYTNIKLFNEAEKQYMTIINETGENADVRFQLGELFLQQGDTTRARAEWRNAIRQDPLHAGARSRLN